MYTETINIPFWLVIPFCSLLLMIATGPLLYEKFWHKNYPNIAILLSFSIILYYIFSLKDSFRPIHAGMEYIQFIAVIAALYIVSGGIYIDVETKSRPLINLSFLFIGALLANFVGTTGASMLLIRPYIRLNGKNIKMYHIVFFIFMVSNIGGALTPIGDPPLFLGFMNGVPFFWTVYNNFIPWITAIVLLGAIFYFLDCRNYKSNTFQESKILSNSCEIKIIGKKNFLWLLLIIGSIFLDPNIFSWLPSVHLGHHEFSFVREVIIFSIAFLAYKFADKTALKKNQFEMGPLKEVVILFIGIFFTMIPAIQIIGDFAASESGKALISCNTLYWGTGALSSVLDNAPTYLNFFAASMSSHGMDLASIDNVRDFSSGAVNIETILQLKSISIAAVFFGAMTYIGNGPNLMVKSIADQYGIKMPSFFGYIFKYSLVYLLPVLALVWFLYI